MRPKAAFAACALAIVSWAVANHPAMANASSAAVREIAGGRFEASGVVHVRDTAGVLFVDDGRAREVFWMPISSEPGRAGAAQRIALDADITDPEGITSDGTFVYVVGSQSKKKGVDGDGLVRFRFDASTRTATQVERIRALKSWLAARVPELKGIERRKGEDALNVEAIAWDARGQRLLLGLRAPVVDGKALVIPLSLRDKSGPFTQGNLEVAPTLRIDLGGSGIRSLEYDDMAKAFTLIAEGTGKKKQQSDFRVLEWDGASSTPGRQIASYPSDLKPEGIARASLGEKRVNVIVFDTGRFAVLE